MSVRVDLRLGDCVEVLRSLPDASVDAVVTDPPYEIGFMGKSWDAAGIAYSVELWRECLRVLKPGGHLLAFGATRTYHRMACAIEDAGFEVRDSIHWIFGSGFPKSLDVSKAIDKMDASEEQERRRLRFTAWVRSTGVTSRQIDEATRTNMGGHYTAAASQPAIMTRKHLEACRHMFGDVPEWVEREADIRSVESRNMAEREVVGIKKSSLGGTVAAKERDSAFIAQHKNLEYNVTVPATDAARQWKGWGTALKPAHEPVVVARKPLGGTVAENVQQHGTGALNIDGTRVGFASDADRARATLTGGRATGKPYSGLAGIADERASFTSSDNSAGRWPPNLLLSHTPECGEACAEGCAVAEMDAQSGTRAAGGASRFFPVFKYQAKAARSEREPGCVDLLSRTGAEAVEREEGSAGTHSPRAGAGRTAKQVRNHHPTVKPVALMQWLVRLVTPPGGVVLDPFTGSGTTGVACVREGFNFLGIEREVEYHAIADARIKHALESRPAQGGLFAESA